MALRSTFNEVIEAVRNETALSTNTSRGVDHLDHIKQIIKRVYATLAETYDWRHLELKRDTGVSRKVLQAGSRYYDYPTAVNPLRVTGLWVKWGSTWCPVEYGITYEDRSAQDPDADQRSDPVTRWMDYGGSQFEVYPLPASNGTANGNNELAFEGQKKVEELTDTSSRLDMDDHLVTLIAASEILAARGQKPAAEQKAAAAQMRLETLRGNTGSGKRVAMGLGVIQPGSQAWPRHPRYIR